MRSHEKQTHETVSGNRTEKEILERFRRGDAGAFEELYAAYGPRLYRFGLRLSGRAADAEDLTQEVFLAAYGSLHRFEGRSSLATYLYKIAVYRWRQMRGCSHPENVRWEEQNEQEVIRINTDPASLGIARLEMREALAALPEAHRAAFLLVKSEGFTCAEAAETLNLPIGTVKYHVYEAVQRLKALLSDVNARKEAADAV